MGERAVFAFYLGFSRHQVDHASQQRRRSRTTLALKPCGHSDFPLKSDSQQADVGLHTAFGRTRMFKFKRMAAAALVAAALALAGCSTGGGAGETGSGSEGGTLTWGVIAQASTFQQKDMRWANESPYGQAVYDSLLI